MQGRAASLSRISQKKHLTGVDAGRALLICTAQSARSGAPVPVPENITEYINSVLLHSNSTDARDYRVYANICTYLSQQRALADAHSMRMFSYLTSQLLSLETGFAVEYALAYFDDVPGKAEAAYREKVPFVGHGIECFLPELFEHADTICNTARVNAETYDYSARYVHCYNVSLRLIEEATSVRLDTLDIDTDLYDRQVSEFNMASERLRRLIAESDTPMKEEKLGVLDTYFGRLAPIREAPISPKALERTREALQNLNIFESGDSPVELLMEG